MSEKETPQPGSETRPRDLGPLHWSEGQFIEPQHFQALQRQLDAGLNRVLDATLPFSWGISSIELDEGALGEHRVQVSSLVARFPDGTEVRVPETTDLPGRPLLDVFRGGDEQKTLYLAIPEWRTRSPNIQEECRGVDEIGRFRVDSQALPDENTGGNPSEVQFRRYQARLLFEGEPLDGFQVLPIARLRLGGSAEMIPELVPEFVPPVTRIDASAVLWNLLQETTTALGAASRLLSEKASHRKLTWSVEGGGGDAEILWKLQAVNCALVEFRLLAQTGSLPPFEVYRAFARLVGSLSVFSATRALPAIEGFDPFRLSDCFAGIAARVRELIQGDVTVQPYQQAPFQVDGELLRSELGEGWCTPTAEAYLGVLSSRAPEDLDRWISALYLSAPRDVETIRSNLLGGIDKKFVTRVPARLPGRDDLHFWRIDRQDPYWATVEEERSLVLFGPWSADPDCKFTLYVLD